MNILITGAFGFVGTNLSRHLKTYFKCHLIAVDIIQPASHYYDEYFSWSDLEKVDFNSLNIIIHLAGKAHDTKKAIDEKAYYDINVGLTKVIFTHYLGSKAEKFIYFSSVKAVADTVSGEFLTEETDKKPMTAYGKSKLVAENYILSQQLAINQRVFILRPSMIHGPGNRGNLNLLYKVVQMGFPWPLGAFENMRSFTSIDNLAFVIIKLIENEIGSGIFQIADDEPVSTNNLIRLISESRGRKTRIWNINPKIIIWISKLGDKLHLPLNSERLKKLTESYIVSNIKIKSVLDISKMPLSSEEGMKKTLLSFSNIADRKTK
jgi:nucleoside-diphosphate-sugar epimerase